MALTRNIHLKKHTHIPPTDTRSATSMLLKETSFTCQGFDFDEVRRNWEVFMRIFSLFSFSLMGEKCRGCVWKSREKKRRRERRKKNRKPLSFQTSLRTIIFSLVVSNTHFFFQREREREKEREINRGERRREQRDRRKERKRERECLT